MTLVVPNAGEGWMLEAIVNKAAQEDLVLRLYTNDITPSDSDTASTFTEASGHGYAAKALTGSSWTVVVGDPSYAVYAQQSFVFTGALGAVYGYYLTRASSGTLGWAERFTGAPLMVSTNGDEIKATPRLELA